MVCSTRAFLRACPTVASPPDCLSFLTWVHPPHTHCSTWRSWQEWPEVCVWRLPGGVCMATPQHPSRR